MFPDLHGFHAHSKDHSNVEGINPLQSIFTFLLMGVFRPRIISFKLNARILQSNPCRSNGKLGGLPKMFRMLRSLHISAKIKSLYGGGDPTPVLTHVATWKLDPPERGFPLNQTLPVGLFPDPHRCNRPYPCNDHALLIISQIHPSSMKSCYSYQLISSLSTLHQSPQSHSLSKLGLS